MLTLVATALSGCSSTSVSLPDKYPPEQAAEMALELYDANGDGKIAGPELDKCLALKYALPRLDANRDKAITADEIAERIRAYESQAAVMGAEVRVVNRQGPINGANVSLQLEPFMAKDVPTYTLTTNDIGIGSPKLEGSDKPLVGIPLGFYRVTIVAPGQEAEVIRGCEVASDSPTSYSIVFSLDQEAPVTSGQYGGR